MVKAVLKFDLEDPDDRDAFDIISKSRDMKAMIWEFSQVMGDMDKHGFDPVLDSPEAMLHALRSKFFEIIEDHDLKPFD